MAADAVPDPPIAADDTIGPTSPSAPPPVTVPINPLPATLPSPITSVVQAGKQVQLRALHRDIVRWRTRASEAAGVIGHTLHFARLSPHLDGATKQLAIAKGVFWQSKVTAKRREAQLWAEVASKGRVKLRNLSSAAHTAEGYALVTKDVVKWKARFQAMAIRLRMDAPRAALYAEWYFHLGDGVHPGPLWLCAQGYHPRDGTGEGGLGWPVWYGGRIDLNPYNDGSTSPYNWLQMMRGTFERMARGFLSERTRGVYLTPVIPSYTAAYTYRGQRIPGHWGDAFYAFMAGGYGFTHGNRGEWAAAACH